MRRIKFRGWDAARKLMFDSELFRCGPSGDIAGVLMQYTGLNDKNGVEIYEGDILDIENEICEVKFNAPSFAAYNAKNHEWNIQYAGVEIIGNIYENPELLS